MGFAIARVPPLVTGEVGGAGFDVGRGWGFGVVREGKGVAGGFWDNHHCWKLKAFLVKIMMMLMVQRRGRGFRGGRGRRREESKRGWVTWLKLV